MRFVRLFLPSRKNDPRRFTFLRLRCSILAGFMLGGGFLGIPTPMQADIIFSNIVCAVCSGGMGLTGADIPLIHGGGPDSLAAAFTPSDNFRMTDAQVEVFNDGPFYGDPYFNLSLFSDASGLPGSLLARLGTNLTPPPYVLPDPFYGLATAELEPGQRPKLDAGTQYWLVMTPGDSTTWIGWEVGANQAVPFAAATSASGQDGWFPRGPETISNVQFRIDGRRMGPPVPEPESLALLATVLLATAFAGVLGEHRREKRTNDKTKNTT